MPDFSTTDVAAHVGQNVPNPLTTLGTLTQLRQAQNQLRLFPLQMQQAQTVLQTSQQALAKTQYDAFNAAIASIPKEKRAAQGPALIARLTQAGVLQPDFAAHAIGGNVPGLAPAEWDTIGDQATLAQGNEAERRANIGDLVQTSAGGHVVGNIVKVGPQGGSSAPAEGPIGDISLTQTPTEQGQMVGYQGQDGQAKQIAKSAIQDTHGHGIPNVKDGEGNQLTDASGALTTTLKPNDVALISSTATNQADRATVLETAFEGSKMRKALAQEMLQANGEFRSGPGAAKWSEIVSEANRIFGTHLAADPATAQQVAGKIAQMLAAQQRDTLGLPATNAGQAAADVASPNTAYSPGAIQTLAGQLAGNEDLLQKKEAAWTKYHKAGGSYNGFVRQFNKAFDPRYFWDQYVPDEQKAETGMTAAQKAEYEGKKKQAMGLAF